MRALLLNSTYEPLKVVGWQKAILLWFQDKVEVIEHHDVFARSVNNRFRIPSVIRLKTYIQVRPRSFVQFSRENIFLRDNHTCQYCGIKLPPAQLTMDHVIPLSRGGKKNWQNIVTSCRDCNHQKGNRTPGEASLRLRRPPLPLVFVLLPRLEINLDNFPESWKMYFTSLKNTG